MDMGERLSRHAVRRAAIASVLLGVVVAFGTGTTQAARPDVVPPPKGTTLLVGGTDDPHADDMLDETVGRGWFAGGEPYRRVNTPAGFGAGWDGVAVVPFVLGDRGRVVTYNGSTAAGTSAVLDALRDTPGPVTLVSTSQGANVVYDAAYIAVRDGVRSPDDIELVMLAPPRFKNTGLEVVAPSLLPGVYTNGPVDPAATAGVQVTMVCIASDPICGFDVYSRSSWFYALPGYVQVHAREYGNLRTMRVISDERDGDIRYVAVDPGFNPWGRLLRRFGIPVPGSADDALTKAVPLDVPGTPPSDHGRAVPTPREEAAERGAGVPETAPDRVDARGGSGGVPPAPRPPTAASPAAWTAQPVRLPEVSWPTVAPPAATVPVLPIPPVHR